VSSSSRVKRFVKAVFAEEGFVCGNEGEDNGGMNGGKGGGLLRWGATEVFPR